MKCADMTGTYALSMKGLYGDPWWKANPNPDGKKVSCNIPQPQYPDSLECKSAGV